MRLVRLKLNKETKAILVTIRRKYNLTDQGMIEDLWSLIRTKGNGLMTDEKLNSAIPVYAKHYKVQESSLRFLLRRRRGILDGLIKTQLFSAVLGLPPEQALETMITMVATLFRKVREAQCGTCTYYKDCTFGQEYVGSVRDIRIVIDKDYKTKVHANCPYLPDLDYQNQLEVSVEFWNDQVKPGSTLAVAVQDGLDYGAYPAIGADPTVFDKMALAELHGKKVEKYFDDELVKGDYSELNEMNEDGFRDMITAAGYGIAGKSDLFEVGEHVGDSPTIIPKDFIENLNKAQLAIYMLGRIFDSKLSSRIKLNKKDVDKTSELERIREMRTEKDITKLQTTQHGLPDEVFEAKLAKKSLKIVQKQEHESKPQLLYVLKDISGSMTSPMGTINRIVFTRMSLATALTLALCRKMRAEKGALFYRGFESGTTELFTAINDADFELLSAFLRANNSAAGGTSILFALKTALDDIEKNLTKIRPREILLISDGCDHSTNSPAAIAEIQARLKKLNVELDVLMIHAYHQTNQVAGLMQMAKRFYHANMKAVSLDQIVSIIKEDK